MGLTLATVLRARNKTSSNRNLRCGRQREPVPLGALRLELIPYPDEDPEDWRLPDQLCHLLLLAPAKDGASRGPLRGRDRRVMQLLLWTDRTHDAGGAPQSHQKKHQGYRVEPLAGRRPTKD